MRRTTVLMAGALVVLLGCVPPADPGPSPTTTTTTSTSTSTTSTSTTSTTTTTTTTLPVGGTPVQVATGDRHSCALRSTGTVSCWGDNSQGQSGAGAPTATGQPPTTVPGLADVTGISAGAFHTCALRDSGEVRCWGSNFSGAIGPNASTTAGVPHPTPLEVGIDDAVAVHAGWTHTCALHADRTVSCWGDNAYGQLGRLDGFGAVGQSARTEPRTVEGLEGVTELSVEGRHSCALLDDSTVACWGSNLDGELGAELDTGLDGWFQPLVIEDLSGVSSLGSGPGVTCAVFDRPAPNLSCWGGNYHGQLGNPTHVGTELPTPTPTPVLGLPDVTAMAKGWWSCALASDGQLWCWGDETVNDPVHGPAPYPGASGITSFDTIGAHVCAVTVNDDVRCWGSNDHGELGRPGGTDPSPEPVVGL